MPFDPRRADAPARQPPRAAAHDDPHRVMQVFLETLARLAARAAQREAAR